MVATGQHVAVVDSLSAKGVQDRGGRIRVTSLDFGYRSKTKSLQAPKPRSEPIATLMNE